MALDVKVGDKVKAVVTGEVTYISSLNWFEVTTPSGSAVNLPIVLRAGFDITIEKNYPIGTIVRDAGGDLFVRVDNDDDMPWAWLKEWLDDCRLYEFESGLTQPIEVIGTLRSELV